MGTVASINKGKSRGDNNAQEAEVILEHAPFVLVGLSAVASLVVYFASVDPVLAWLAVVITQAAVIVGLVNYILKPDEFAPKNDTQPATVSQIDWARQRKLS